MPLSSAAQRAIMSAFGLTAPAFAEYAEYAAYMESLLEKAMFITGRTRDEVQAAVAQTPYPLDVFVQLLAAGRVQVEPL